ncbi:MAG: tetratricopeptide repeat protein, partial [Deltaproteobacteria bacterium]|nr:tetratricopeptide repeat protein [Deltaproteobacteria bacterium]
VLKKRVLELLKVLAGKRPRAWFFRAVIFERLGHPERVVAAVAHLPLGGSDRIRGELLVARAAVKRADFGAALAVAKRFSRTCPEFWPTEILRGKALLALERRAEARRVFERVRCAGRETPSLLISLARASLDLREGRKRGVTRAVALIAVARKLFGPAAKGDFARVAAVAQAEVALLQGHARDAVALLKKRPRTVTTLLLRARAYGRMGDIGSARRALKEVLKSEPKNVWARLLLGDLVLRGGSRGRRRARGLHEAAARLFEEARRLAGAEGLLASHALAWAQLGVARIALSEHHPGAAAKAARRSIDVEPDWWAPYRWLGEALLVQKKWKQAQKALQRATELTSTDATSFLLLGRSLRHGSASKTAYRAFLRLEPRSRRAKKVRRLLRRLH